MIESWRVAIESHRLVAKLGELLLSSSLISKLWPILYELPLSQTKFILSGASECWVHVWLASIWLFWLICCCYWCYHAVQIVFFADFDTIWSCFQQFCGQFCDALVRVRFFLYFLWRKLLNLICLNHNLAVLLCAMVGIPKIGYFKLYRFKLAWFWAVWWLDCTILWGNSLQVLWNSVF